MRIVNQWIIFICAASLSIGFICHAHKWSGEMSGRMPVLSGTALEMKETLYGICNVFLIVGLTLALTVFFINRKKLRNVNEKIAIEYFNVITLGYITGAITYGLIWYHFYFWSL